MLEILVAGPEERVLYLVWPLELSNRCKVDHVIDDCKVDLVMDDLDPTYQCALNKCLPLDIFC